MSVDVWTSAFRASGGMPSGPAALPDLRKLMAFTFSCYVGCLVLTSSSCVAAGMSGGAGGGCLIRISLKRSVHLALCSSSPVMVSPFSVRTFSVPFVSDRASWVACFSRQHSCDLIESHHISLPRLSLCFLRELVDEGSLVFPRALLHLPVGLPIERLKLLLLLTVLRQVDLLLQLSSDGNEVPCIR